MDAADPPPCTILLATVVLVAPNPFVRPLWVYVGSIVHQRIESDQRTIGPVVHSKRIAICHFAIAIAYIDSRVATLEMITEDVHGHRRKCEYPVY